MIEGSCGGTEAEARRRDGAGSFLVDGEVKQALLGGSVDVRAAARSCRQTPASVQSAPSGGDLKRVADGAASFNAGVEILLQALGNALLIGPDIDRLANEAGAGSMKNPLGVSRR